MATDDRTGKRPGGDAPRVVAPSSRVNVALPFSHMRIEQPSPELAELTGIVVELLEHMGPDRQLEPLLDRARGLAGRLR